MKKPEVEIALMLNPDRSLPPAVYGQLAQAYQASGAVDYVHVPDQLMGWWPPHLWNRDNSPLADMVPDLDSSADAGLVCAYAAAAAPGIGATISTDAIRRGPAETMQTMLTLANMGSGKALLQIGAGEVKQARPFGWNRAEGLKRQEDHFRFYDAFWKGNGEVTLQGNCWNFERAWIGGARQNRPKMYALGGGPKLIDIATSYADGFASVTPNIYATAEHFASIVKTMRESVEAKGRDPQQFGFCLWIFTLMHDDPEVISRALDNPIVRWLAAIYGRMNMNDWAAYGEESAFPLDWHYAMKFIPNRFDDPAEADRILSRTTRRMAELCFITGNAKQIADKVQPFVDAGVTCVDLIDMLPLVLDASEMQASVARQLDACAMIKKRNS